LHFRGLDLAKEVEIFDGLALGDTLLFERGREFLGFAVYHTPGVSEAPAGALYVKFLALDPQHKRVENLEQSLAAVEEAAAEIGVQRVILPVYTRYWSACSAASRRITRTRPIWSSTIGVERASGCAARRRPRRGAGNRGCSFLAA